MDSSFSYANRYQNFPSLERKILVSSFLLSLFFHWFKCTSNFIDGDAMSHYKDTCQLFWCGSSCRRSYCYPVLISTMRELCSWMEWTVIYVVVKFIHNCWKKLWSFDVSWIWSINPTFIPGQHLPTRWSIAIPIGDGKWVCANAGVPVWAEE